MIAGVLVVPFVVVAVWFAAMACFEILCTWLTV